MRQLPIFSGIWNYLTAPEIPRTSLSISETHLSLVTLRRTGGEFEPRNLGVLRIPAGLVRASFTEPNIVDETALMEHLTRTADQAGMKRIRAMSATLPATSARSLVVSLDSIPATRAEFAQILEWKVERNIGRKFSELRVNYTRLSDFNGRPHYLVSVASEAVIEQYEEIFRRLGWQVGLIAPQHIGEAQWLIRQNPDDDQAVVSLHDRGFDVVIVRGREPILVREVDCAPEERENELYRLMVFYRDRLLPAGSDLTLSRVLTIGGSADRRRFRDVVASALERQAVSLDPQHLGLRVDPHAPFTHFAASSGLATMAWG
jgi:Tfp pilus assembly PilM family ATPase